MTLPQALGHYCYTLNINIFCADITDHKYVTLRSWLTETVRFFTYANWVKPRTLLSQDIIGLVVFRVRSIILCVTIYWTWVKDSKGKHRDLSVGDLPDAHVTSLNLMRYSSLFRWIVIIVVLLWVINTDAYMCGNNLHIWSTTVNTGSNGSECRHCYYYFRTYEDRSYNSLTFVCNGIGQIDNFPMMIFINVPLMASILKVWMHKH
jgi:hypothetical protein